MSGSVSPGANVSIALLHYPVHNKHGEVVATAITNLDIHDIARAAKTFGLFRYFVVTPVAGQQEMADRIGRHWRLGWGASYNPKRRAALELMAVVDSLDEALYELEQQFGCPAKIVVTGAANNPGSISCGKLAEMIKQDNQPYLLIFGTGWGLTDLVFSRADIVLEPVRGSGAYNHLSVRSAAAIILDRLLGCRST